MNNDWPSVSVVVPVYNAEQCIEDCLHSILQQDYPRLQVTVVDDGSSDRSADLVQRLSDDRITYRLQRNSGSAVARNLGVQLAEGDYIAFNDSDNLWAPGRLKQQLAYLRGQSEYQAVCGRFMAVPDASTLTDAAAQVYHPEAKLDPARSGWTCLMLLESSIHHIDTLLVRSQVMKSIRFNPRHRRSQDFDFFLQLLHATPIAQLDNLYAFYRQNPQSITRRPRRRSFRAEILGSALERWGRKDQLGRERSAQKLDQLLATSWFGHGDELLRARWFREASRSFRRALHHDPSRWSICRHLRIGWLRRPQDRSPQHGPGH